MGLRGGVKKVIKTIVKSKTTEKTVDADRPLYEQAFVNALDFHKATHLNSKEMIKVMSPKQLETLRDFIIHNKTTNDKKIAVIAEYLPIFEPLNVVAMKVNAAMEQLKILVENSLSDQCSDKDGNIKMNSVLEVVKFRIEYKKESEKESDMAL